MQHEELFQTLWFDPDVAPEEGLHDINDYLAYIADYQRPELSNFRIAAVILVDRNWQPRRVFDLLRNADKLMDQWHARMTGDNQPAEEEDLWAFSEMLRRQDAAGWVLAAARLAEQPEQAERVKAFVERDLPPKISPRLEELYWHNRGRLAAAARVAECNGHADGHTAAATRPNCIDRGFEVRAPPGSNPRAAIRSDSPALATRGAPGQ